MEGKIGPIILLPFFSCLLRKSSLLFTFSTCVQCLQKVFLIFLKTWRFANLRSYPHESFWKEINVKTGENVESPQCFFAFVNYAENTLKNSTLNFNTSFCWSHTVERGPKNEKSLLSNKTSETFPTDFALKSNRKYHSSRLPIIYIVDYLL